MKRCFWGLVTGIFLIIANSVHGQIGHGTSDPSKAAVVEMLSPSKGLLIPRVELTKLTGLNSFSPIQGELATNEAKVNSLLVYNTATAGTAPNNVTPGYYYWTSETILTPGRWNRLVNDADIAALGLNVTADNGLTKTDDNIQLGGALTGPTSIGTDNTNTLAIQGLQTGSTTDRVVVADPTSGILKQLKAALPKFFYMPSIIIPTALDHIPQEYNTGPLLGAMTFNDIAKTGSINLHAIYAAQFNGISGSSVKSPGAGTLPVVIQPNELNYYITWYDNTLFDNVAVTDAGILTYHVSSSTADEGSFMNIVFEVRETPPSP